MAVCLKPTTRLPCRLTLRDYVTLTMNSYIYVIDAHNIYALLILYLYYILNNIYYISVYIDFSHSPHDKKKTRFIQIVFPHFYFNIVGNIIPLNYTLVIYPLNYIYFTEIFTSRFIITTNILL